MLVILLIALVANATFVGLLSGRVPERVATHFNIEGVPDGWMSRKGFFWFGVIFPVAICAFMFFMSTMVAGALPLKVPNADYWNAPAHLPEASRRIQNWLVEIATLTTLFLMGTWWLVAKAQRTRPIRLPQREFWSFLVGFLVLIAVLCFQLSNWNIPGTNA